MGSLDDQDGAIAADMLGKVIEHDPLALHPRVRAERVNADADDPARENSLAGQEMNKHQGVVEAPVMRGQREGAQAHVGADGVAQGIWSRTPLIRMSRSQGNDPIRDVGQAASAQPR